MHFNIYSIEILIYSTPCMMLDLERRGMKMLHIILLLSPILYQHLVEAREVLNEC